MTTAWVEMRRTGRGAQSYSFPAGNHGGAINIETTVNTPDQWVFSRFSAARQFLDRWPATESDNLRRSEQEPWSGDALASEYRGARGAIETINAAMIATAHWGLETGWGANEWNYNAGGIHCAANSAECFRENAPAGEVDEEFLAYSSLPAFLQSYFELVARTPMYADAWRYFRAGSANGIVELWRADYSCGAKTKSEATSLVARVARVVTAQAPEVGAALPLESAYRATVEDVPNRCRSGRSERRVSGSGGGSRSGAGPLVLGALLLAAAAGK